MQGPSILRSWTQTHEYIWISYMSPGKQVAGRVIEYRQGTSV